MSKRGRQLPGLNGGVKVSRGCLHIGGRALPFLVPILFLALSRGAGAAGSTYRWDGGTTGTLDWNNPTNWYNVTAATNDTGFPSAPGDVAGENTMAMSAVTTRLNQDITVGQVLFTSAGNSTITLQEGVAGSRLIFDNEGAQARWEFHNNTALDLRMYVQFPVVLSDDLLLDYRTDRTDGYFSGVISEAAGESHSVTFDVRGNDATDALSIQGTNANTFSGGTIVTSSASYGCLILKKNGALGTGNLSVLPGGLVQIIDLATNDDAIADTASVLLSSNATKHGRLQLASGVNETVFRLYLNGVLQPSGSWGASASAAAHKDDTWFVSGSSGILTVVGGPVVVNDPAASAIDTNGATVEVTVAGVGQTVDSRGTYYGTAAAPTENSETDPGSGTGTFTRVLSGLDPATHYYVRGWASNATEGIVYSADREFYTEPLPDTAASAGTAENIRRSLSWERRSAGTSTLVVMRHGSAVDQLPADGTSYAAHPVFGCGQDLGGGNFVVYSGAGTNVTVTELDPGETYYWAVFSSAGSGALLNYQQDGVPEGHQATSADAGPPRLVLSAVSGIDTYSAVLGATVATNRGAAVTAWGTAWGTAPQPAGNLLVVEGETNGVFAHLRTGLDPATHYYARGWASNATGEAWAPVDVEFYTEPLAATGLEFPSVTSWYATVSWTPGNGSGRLVVMKKGSGGTALPADGATYAASAVFGSGADVGGGSYAVYAGTNSSVLVTNLMRSTTYSVAVFEYAGDGALLNYQQDGEAAGVVTSASEVLSFQYDGTTDGNGDYEADWDDALNYTADRSFPGYAGDQLLCSSAAASFFKMNGSRTLAKFRKTVGLARNMGIVPGSDSNSVLTWATQPGEGDAEFYVRGSGGTTTNADLRCLTMVDMVLATNLVWDGATQRGFSRSTVRGTGNGYIMGDISGPGKLTVKWNACVTNVTGTTPMNMEIWGGAGPNTHKGGTEFQKNDLGTRAGFRLNKQHATGDGDTTVGPRAEIYVATVAANGGAINDATSLYLRTDGTNYAGVNLESGVNESICSLYLYSPDSMTYEMQSAGTYGSSTSGAQFQKDEWFSGTGKLTVLKGRIPAILLLVK